MPKVFICYRRDDSIDTAGRIYSWLKMRLPEDEVFFDVNTIRPGANFRSAIEEALSKGVEVMLVIIGKTWLVSTAENGGVRRRLEEEDDHVRREIETALALNKTLIPVLVQEATMPARSDLPASIAPLSDINAIQIRPEPDFDNDMRKLREAIHAHRPTVPFQAPHVPYSTPPYPGQPLPPGYPQPPAVSSSRKPRGFIARLLGK